jgi:hypothetical protein
MFSHGKKCPNCGELNPSHSGKIQRTAGAALLGLALTAAVPGCDGPDSVTDDMPQPEYGIAFIDNDNDGWEEGEDCDDNNEDIHPEAEETPGDGVDSNCDGNDDT